ncbi:MAG: signal peptidase I [Spirochaetes bacterium]|nr:signal peptidase I [Spirochaetota bacterium]MBU1079271.1 signal peptidase I [Spirochaetota bacterium]
MKRVQSFEDVKRKRSRVMRFAKYVVLIFFAFESFSAFALKSWVVGSTSMMPTLSPKDRVIVASSAYGVLNPFSGTRTVFKAPKRGDVVLIRRPSSEHRAWHKRLLDSALHFLSLQRLGAPGVEAAFDSPVIKRVVAGPGDSVMMDGYIVYVRTAGTSHYLTEYEVSGGDYDIAGARPIDGWDKAMPLAGSMEAMELGPDEFFVVGDERFSSPDSRFFGPVRADHFLGKVVARYWPLDRISGF